ncbi:hypothetical protein N665_0150s0009 [Sinapis alba]|nr:hypothetical protein N665_0150s0009 [Sinapis alba]
MRKKRRSIGDDDKGLLWKLPQVRIKDVGKVGPAFGLVFGCGFGFGAGLIEDSNQEFLDYSLVLGFGADCGIGVGFGYGIGRGAAYDHSRSYYNIGKPFL